MDEGKLEQEILANKNVITEDLEAYVKFLTEYRECLICNTSDYETWATYGSYRAVKCKGCGLVWINPHLSEEGMRRYYENYIGMRMKEEVKMKQREIQYRIDADFIQNFVSSGRVLDVGCSGGFFLNTLADSFEKYGIDIDPKAVEYAKRNFSFGKNVSCQSIENTSFPNKYFDLVIMRGVVEHLPDPKAAVGKISELLKEDGYLYIAATPNVKSFCANLYREKWNLFHPVRHIWYFSAETLAKLCSPFNLRLVCKYYPYEETPYAHIDHDCEEVLKAWKAKRENKFQSVGRSPSFWGNIMNLVFKKTVGK
ncbi:MAG: class I SAM-dependent methyltransferase [Candidatus Jordarchaeaceae archaeon]